MRRSSAAKLAFGFLAMAGFWMTACATGGDGADDLAFSLGRDQAERQVVELEMKLRDAMVKGDPDAIEGLLANGDQSIQAQFDAARTAHADAESALAGLRTQLADSEKAAAAGAEAHARAQQALQELDRELAQMLEAYLAALPDRA